MQPKPAIPAPGTQCLCTPDLVLLPQNHRWVALNKADWQAVGQAKVNKSGQLQHIDIAPDHRRQGLATQIRQAFPDPTLVPEAALDKAAIGWLKHLGWDEGSRALPAATGRNLSQYQREQAEHWAATLKIPANYSQSRKLALVSEPAHLQCLGADTQGRAIFLTPAASAAFAELRRAAATDNIILEPVSGFRSIGYQARLVSAKLAAGIPMQKILTVSAAPGYSEHHSGAALDISTPASAPLEPCFADTPAFAWLTQEAKRWNFVLSYPENNPHQLAFEPWHWCFRDS